jgi:uncharacterized membrane protein YjgN (DUF898 family)
LEKIMPDATYEIVFRGELLPRFDKATVKRNLMARFGIDADQAESILARRRVVLKKGLSEAAAGNYAAAFEACGIRVTAVIQEPREGSILPPFPPSTIDARSAPMADSTPVTGFTEAAPASEDADRAPSAPAAVETAIPFQFTGTGSEYFKIWIVNIVLSILTMGIYSAWAKVRRKQYFYGCTRLSEASFSYLADPVKILKGRIVVAVGFIVYSSLSEVFPIAGAILTLVFLCVLPWLVVRSLKFNAVNSAVRNIRFGFHGTVGGAARVFLLWPLLSILTLGLLFPRAYYRQKQFLVDNTSYGQTRFSFKAGARDYYRLFLSALVPMLIGAGLIVGVGFLAEPLILLAGVAVYLYLFAFYSVKTTNLLFSKTALAAHRLKADLRVMDYSLLVLTNTLGIVFTLGLFNPWAKVRTTKYKLTHLTFVAAGDLSQFVAAEQERVNALGDEMSDLMDFDFGL